MWRPSQTLSLSFAATQEPSSISTPERKLPAQVCDDLRSCSSEEAKIGRGQFVKGKISGTGPLFIDGRVEGDIDVPNERVTIGEHGVFVAHARKDGQFGITAREIVILGKVRGNVTASDRVDIRAEGALTGDVAAARISIEDGAFFKGGIDIRKNETKPAALATGPAAPLLATPAPEAPRPVQI